MLQLPWLDFSEDLVTADLLLRLDGQCDAVRPARWSIHLARVLSKADEMGHNSNLAWQLQYNMIVLHASRARDLLSRYRGGRGGNNLSQGPTGLRTARVRYVAHNVEIITVYLPRKYFALCK